MRAMRRSRVLLLLALVAGVGSACTLLTDLSGLDDAPQPPEVGNGADGPAMGADGATDASVIDALADGAAADASIDACATFDLTSDPEHCGTCSRRCFGGACTAGKCLPVTIVSGLPSTIGLAVAGGKLYVSVPGYIRQYLLDGGQGIDIAPSPSPRYIAADSTYLYWADTVDDSVKRWPLVGGGVETLVTNANAVGIAVSSTHVYFTHYDTDGGVERALLDGGGRETVLAFYDHPEDVDFANGELIVGGDGVDELAVIAAAGFGAKRVLSSGNGPCTMCVAGGDVFFGEQSSGNILRVPLAGGGKELIATGARVPTGLAATSDSLYWLNYDGGTIMRLAR